MSLLETFRSRSMSKDMPSTLTRCCDSTYTSCTLEKALPSQGDTAVSLFLCRCGGVTAAMTACFISGVMARRLQSKYDDDDTEEEVYEGADVEVS